MTILEQIVWNIVQMMIHLDVVRHAFHADGLTFWCQHPHRVRDAVHPSRLLHLNCWVNGITGMAHPAGK